MQTQRVNRRLFFNVVFVFCVILNSWMLLHVACRLLQSVKFACRKSLYHRWCSLSAFSKTEMNYETFSKWVLMLKNVTMERIFHHFLWKKMGCLGCFVSLVWSVTINLSFRGWLLLQDCDPRPPARPGLPAADWQSYSSAAGRSPHLEDRGEH